MTKKNELLEIVACCETRFKRGDATLWKHSDFTDLSREIFKETDVNISSNTLKRIFGKISVDDDYLPQQATIDALKKYGNYTSTTASVSETAVNEPLQTSKPKVWKQYKWVLLFSIILIPVLVLMINRKTVSASSASITLTGTEGHLPATAFFALQLPAKHADSLFVEFGDKSLLLYVPEGQKSIAHNYLFPGVFTVTLKTKKEKLSATRIVIRSDKWIALGFRRQSELPDRYYEFPAVKTGSDSLFHLPNSQLHRMGLDTVGLFFTRLCNYTPITSTSEDFIFEASFKNSFEEKGFYCKGTQFQISGINGTIRFKLVNTGCSYRVINVVSEQVFEGSQTNLSQFTANLAQWNTVKIINKAKQVTLLVNDQEIFKGTYQISIGAIQGVFLEFEGNGFVKTCDLKTIQGNTLYQF